MTGVVGVIEDIIINDSVMATKNEQIAFVKTIYPAAKALWEKQDSINPLFVTAQAALETGWRLSDDGTNNLFGITKGSSWTGGTKLCPTVEYFSTPDKSFNRPEWVVSVEKIGEGRYKYRVCRLFRVYDSIEGCLNDHLAVLRKSGYADAYGYRNDPKEFAKRISDSTGAKYATAPNYAATMGSMIDSVERIVKEQGL
jgi:flagellar protein FlgJ